MVEPQPVNGLAPDWPFPFVAFLNGEPLLRADWERELGEGESLAFVDVDAIPQGGGGGGSNPLKTIALLAVSYYTLGAGAAWASGFEGAAAFAIKGGAYLVGTALVNALLPAPKSPSTLQAAALSAPSPTYSLQAQGNAARLEAAIPEQFGRMAAYPDFAAQPYQEFSGNEQYLYQLLCIGRGDYEIEQIRVEDTPISSFEEITYEVVGPNQPLTLFPANVISSPEVAGQDVLCKAATYNQAGTTLTVTLASHGLGVGKQVYLNFTSGSAASGTYSVVSAPTQNTFTVSRASATTSGNVNVSPWVGPFVASAPETSANRLAVDYVLARGLYYANDNGSLTEVSLTLVAEMRLINESGVAIGPWTDFARQTYTAATSTPQRFSERSLVFPGRYEMRVRREDVEQTDTRYGHHAQWIGLRAYLADSRTFGDVTLLAMRLRASNNLSLQASRKINVICTRKLPAWNGSGFSAPQPSRSIAWAIAYTCKQMGLPDSQIDLAGLLALDQIWSARGDTFDGRFDNFLGFWEAASKIAAAGRAKPFMQGGVFRIVRDQVQSIPVALYSTRNILKGSFGVTYMMPTDDTADAVDVGYFDMLKWAPAKVRAKLSGSLAAKPSKVDLFGVVSRDQAFREGMYIAAANRYRRKIIKFATEMEGFIPSFGDLIAIQHDLPSWGQSGEIVQWNATTRVATLSEKITFSAGVHYMALRKRDGSLDGPYQVSATADPFQVIFQAVPAITPLTGGNQERTHFVFGLGDGYRQRARVLSVKPTGQYRVEIEAVNEDDRVHSADTGETMPVAQFSGLANYTNAPVIRGLLARSMPGSPEKMLLTWEPSAWAEYYLVEQSSDEKLWTRCGETTTSNFTATALYGSATILRVAAVGVARGPWVTLYYGKNADYVWGPSESALMWSADQNQLMWRY